MRFRKLRIAWSVMCGIACLLLIVLWAHTVHNQIKGFTWVSDSRTVSFVIFRHWIQFDGGYYDASFPDALRPDGYYYDHHVDHPDPLTSPVHRWLAQHHNPPLTDRSTMTIAGPLWCPILLTTLLAILPWTISLDRLRRFSLRTLLIATTLVALVLGLAVWAARK